MRRIVMTYKYVDVINWLRGVKIDRWAEKEAVRPGEPVNFFFFSVGCQALAGS